MSDEELLWPEWTDVLGNTYRPGDIVCVAVINGKSPQQVIGEVIQINKSRKVDQYIDGRYQRGVLEPIVSTHAEIGEDGRYVRTTVPSCTVRIKPLIDARGFRRLGEAKAVTYQIPANILKLSATREDLETVPKPPRG